MFDLSGRLVGLVRVMPGEQILKWEWREGQLRAGVYLARLRGGSDAVRFVVLR